MKRFVVWAMLMALSGCVATDQPVREEVRRAQPVNGTAGAYIPGRNWDRVNDYARFLAGMPGGEHSPLRGSRESAAWQEHRWKMDQLWKRVEGQRLSKIRGWRYRELGGLTSHPIVFYPFSGPDFLFADAFFPGARTYVLCGLESPDLMPDFESLSPPERESVLRGLHGSLTTVLNFSYFITKEMRVDLKRTKMSGVLPIISIFMARTGHRINRVEAVALAGNGTIVSGNKGMRILCSSPQGVSKVVYYFREDLGNGNLRRNPKLLNFVSAHGTPVTYLKSASYLLHEGSFSVARNAILNRSTAILQDDSGIPLKAFDQSRYWLVYYGNYTGVLDIFSKYYQPDLAAVYESGSNVLPMNFGVGYKFNPSESSLILARQR